MRNKWLNATIAALRRLSAETSRESVCDPRLITAIKELEKVRRSGKVDPQRIYRAVTLVSEMLLENSRDSNADSRQESARKRAR